MMNKAITITESIAFDLPAEEVWAYVEDYSNDINWRTGLVEMTPTPPGPPSIGTSVHEVVKKAGSTYVTKSMVTEVGERSYRFSGAGTSGGVSGGRSVSENGEDQAVFTYDIELRLSGLQALAAPVVHRFMRSSLRNDLERLQLTIGNSD